MTPDKPSDPEIRKLQLPTGTAGVTDPSDGPALVSIHGLPGSVRDFRWLGSCVETALRFVRIDMPGFGTTDAANIRDASIGSRARFFISVLDALEIDQCVVLGHSMGGPVAMELAAEHSDRVRGLALLSSVGLRPHKLLRSTPHIDLIARALDIGLLRTLMMGRIRNHFIKAGFPSSTEDDAIVQCIRWVNATDFELINRNVKALEIPCFLAWALDDAWIEEDVFRELAHSCPSGPRLEFDEGGHNIQKTHAVEIGQALVEWVPWVLSDVRLTGCN